MKQGRPGKGYTALYWNWKHYTQVVETHDRPVMALLKDQVGNMSLEVGRLPGTQQPNKMSKPLGSSPTVRVKAGEPPIKKIRRSLE